MATSDVLYSLCNNFFTGNYQAAINESQSGMDDEGVDEETKNIFVNRCYIALGNYQLVIDEIDDSSSPSLLAVKYFAQFLNAPEQGNDIVEKLTSLHRTETVSVILTTIYYQQGKFEEGLKAISVVKTMEAEALQIHGLIAINRTDKATEILTKMQKEDEDNILCTICAAWISVAKGTEGLKDSYYLFQELIDKFAASPALLNGLAVYNLKTDKFDEAKSALQEAIEKSPNDPDTLANLISCTAFENKPIEQVNQLLTRRIRQLKGSAPDHKWVQSLENFEKAFDTNAARFSASK